MDKQPFIVAFPPGNLSDVDRARLEEAGIIAVEAVDPEAIVHIHSRRRWSPPACATTCCARHCPQLQARSRRIQAA